MKAMQVSRSSFILSRIIIAIFLGFSELYGAEINGHERPIKKENEISITLVEALQSEDPCKAREAGRQLTDLEPRLLHYALGSPYYPIRDRALDYLEEHPEIADSRMLVAYLDAPMSPFDRNKAHFNRIKERQVHLINQLTGLSLEYSPERGYETEYGEKLKVEAVNALGLIEDKNIDEEAATPSAKNEETDNLQPPDKAVQTSESTDVNESIPATFILISILALAIAFSFVFLRKREGSAL